MTQIGGGWTEHFTADGKAYYHHAATQQTTWDKPPEARSTPPALPSNPPAVPKKAPAVMTKPNTSTDNSNKPPVELLAAIRSSTTLKKSESESRPPSSNVTGHVVENHSRGGHAVTNGNSRSSGGGNSFMGELASAMNRRGSLPSGLNGASSISNSSHNLPSFVIKGRPNGTSSASNSVPASKGPPPLPSNMPPSVPAQSPPALPNGFTKPLAPSHLNMKKTSLVLPQKSVPTENSALTVEQRLESIESKLNKIMRLDRKSVV